MKPSREAARLEDPVRSLDGQGRVRCRTASLRSTHHVLASVIIVAAAAFVYRAVASAYFFDDEFQWLVGTWTFQPVHLLDVAHLSHFYRPVIDVYFATATPLFRGSPTLFHLANIGLHAANGLLLLALARAMSRSTAYGFLTALFFVVQPADVDAIAWVSALAEAVGAFFGCLALFWFLQFRRSARVSRAEGTLIACDERTEGSVKRTNGAIEPDVAALFKRGDDLRREAEELHRAAEELAKKRRALKEEWAIRKRPTP